jgi:hypothetical protein
MVTRRQFLEEGYVLGCLLMANVVVAATVAETTRHAASAGATMTTTKVTSVTHGQDLVPQGSGMRNPRATPPTIANDCRSEGAADFATS